MSYLGNCDICGGELYAEFVDIGVGLQQVTPEDCGNGCQNELENYDRYEQDCRELGVVPQPFEQWAASFLDFLKCKSR